MVTGDPVPEAAATEAARGRATGPTAGGAAPAVIFDCDGVLADTERYGHLPAFNETFRKFGLPVRWSVAEYGEKLRIGGGKERMASLFDDPAFAVRRDLTREQTTRLAYDQLRTLNRELGPGTELLADPDRLFALFRANDGSGRA